MAKIKYLIPLSNGKTEERTGRSFLFPLGGADVNFVIQDKGAEGETFVVHRASGNKVGMSLQKMWSILKSDPLRARHYAECSEIDCACFVLEDVVKKRGADAVLKAINAMPALNKIPKGRI